MGTTLTKPVLLDETGQDISSKINSVLKDSTGQAIVGKLEDIQQAIGGTGEFIPINIRVTTPPTKTSYLAGETLDLSGIVVTLVANNGGMYDITGDCVFSPADGSTVTSSTTEVNISYTWYKDSTVFTAVQPIGIKELVSIAVTTPPTQTEYYVGDALDLTGIVVTATFADASTEDVTNQCTFSPADGSILSTTGTNNITVSLIAGVQTYTATQNITVEPRVPSWATGTDQEIIDALTAHYAGEIDLHEYWSVGDERTITVEAMSATGVNESHEATALTFVIMNQGGKTLEDGTTECAFIVGVKEDFRPEGYIYHGAYAVYWATCDRKIWCSDVFYNAIPSSIKSIFKRFKNKSRSTSSTPSAIDEYFSLPAEVEITGSNTNSMEGEGTQFDYYKTSSNRIKLRTDTHEPGAYWTRSSVSSRQYYITIKSDGTPTTGMSVDSDWGLSPFGCI